MKKVVIYKYERVVGQTHCDKVPDGHGMFHQWGCDYEEFENGAGNFSTAIVELPDGSVRNIPVELIVFNH